jgi:metallophosphoesterase superfamily enzyme
MPITLPPISRRRFLGASVAGLSTALLPQWLRAADAAALDPHRFALLSDIHIDADPKFAKSDTNVWNNLQQASGEILAMSTKPAAVLVNGDLTHHQGRPEDYATVIKALAPMREGGLTLHLSMGNHDMRENFWKALPADDGRHNGLPNRQVCVVEAARANFIMLDSLNVTTATPGLLGPAQIAWLNKMLDARADKPAIVFVHHDPDLRTDAQKKDSKKKVSGLIDTQAFFDSIFPRKQVKAYVFGHTHDWHYLERDGVHFINLPPTAWLFKAGRPRGWVDLNLADAGATFELRSLDPKHPQHGQKLDLKWR